MQDRLGEVRDWYDTSYAESALKAQRRYPNEEFARFLGRHFFDKPPEERDRIRILELGCGSCANLWVVAREGFDACGLDIAAESIRLGDEMIKSWGGRAELRVGSMTEIPWADESFDAVIDVFSSCCLVEKDFGTCLAEVERVLKAGGLFFSYTPGKGSDAYQNHAPAKLLDSSTLDGIRRIDSPFSGNLYPFRFVHPEEYAALIQDAGMEVRYLETIRRSYRGRTEDFEHVVVEGLKVGT